MPTWLRRRRCASVPAALLICSSMGAHASEEKKASRASSSAFRSPATHRGGGPPRSWYRRASLEADPPKPLVQVTAQSIHVLRPVESPSLPASGAPTEGL